MWLHNPGLLNSNAVESASGITEDFESASLDSNWTTQNCVSISSTQAQSGSQSLVYTCDAQSYAGIWEPSELSDGVEISELTIYMYETSSSQGQVAQIDDGQESSSNPLDDSIMAFGSNNPQWELLDTSSNSWVRPYDGDGVDRWIKYNFKFDWTNGEYDYFVEDLTSGTTRSGTLSLNRNVPMKRLVVHAKAPNNSGGQAALANSPVANEAWWDNITIKL